MTPERYQLRGDVVVSRQETREGTRFILKDPATGRYFRFGEAEYFIIQQLPNVASFEAIQREAEQKFGTRLAWDTLTGFLEKLRRSGLLEPEQTVTQLQAGRPKRLRGSLLYLRLTAFDPDALLTRMAGWLRFFFTSHFVVLSAALVPLATAIVISNWSQLQHDVHRLSRWDTLLLVWIFLYAVTAAHEFAHGLTCKHFGGEVHEMGLLLIYFQPAFYCNVSDAWLLPKKYQRLWVSFAGAYFELFLCSLGTLVWRLTEPGTALSSLALIVMVTSAVKTFFNLNPLIKMDGYYLLSDYLEIPNLRSRSFAYLRTTLHSLAPGTKPLIERSVSIRESRVYLAYGLLAAAYSYSLLGLVTVNLGGYLTRRYQGLGFLLTLGLLAAAVQAPLRRAVAREATATAPPAKNRGPLRKIILWAAGAALVSAVLYFGRMELKLSSEFRILPSMNAEVRAEVEGTIDEIYADEGVVVQSGDRIARLSNRDLEADLRMAEAAIAEKNGRLRMLLAGARPEEIDLGRKTLETAKTRREFALGRYEEAKQIRAGGLSKARASLSRAEERVVYAAGYLENAKRLFEGKLISREQLEKAREETAVRDRELEETKAALAMTSADDLAEVRRLVAVAEKELEEAQSNLALLLAGTRPEEIEVTRAEIASLESRRNHLRDQLGRLQIRAASAGVITTAKLKERIGQSLSKGDLIATVHQLNSVTAEIVSPEKEIGDVSVGQRVELKARAYPGESFLGRVTSIAPVATKNEEGPLPDERYVRVSSQVDNTAHLLKGEMTGRAKIYCGQRRILDVVSRRVARYVRIEFWSWW